jgi:hypothetical protein
MRRDNYYDEYEEYEVTEEDVSEACRSIKALTTDYNGRRTYTRAVDRVFFDIFGINHVGSAFATSRRSQRDTEYRIYIFRKCGAGRLCDMMLDSETYYLIQNLVKLYYDLANAKVKSAKTDEAIGVYNDTIDGIKKRYGIRTKSSIDSITDPLKSLKKYNRSYDDYGYDDYDYDYDYDYDDYGYDDRGYRGRRKSRRRTDEDEYDDIATSIFDGIEGYDTRDRRSRNSSKRKRQSSDRRSDDSDDGYSESDSTASALRSVAESVEQISDRLSNLERGGYSKNNYEPSRDDDSVKASIDALSRSVNSLAKSQKNTRADLDDVISIIKEALVEEDEDDTENSPGVMPPPPTSSGGELGRSTGGIPTNNNG